MTTLEQTAFSTLGVDTVALKPAEMGLDRATALPVERVTIDYEGRDHLPAAETLERLTDAFEVRVTVPVRADGFDPLGDDDRWEALPDDVRSVLVAGHPAYLTEDERKRAVAPRLKAATESVTEPWVGTENVERVALAVGGTQFELLSKTTRRDIGALRRAGFDGDVAVYAPIVVNDDEDVILDAVGAYASRRGSVRENLPSNAPTDSDARGEAREILLEGCRNYALVGDSSTLQERIDTLRSAGVDHVVGYPARGLDAVVE